MGRTDQTIARTDSVRIKLAPEMVERLERLASSYGMPVSTMGAFALADWINKQEQQRRLTEHAVVEATRSTMANFGGSDIEKFLTPDLLLRIAQAEKAASSAPAIDCKATEVAS